MKDGVCLRPYKPGDLDAMVTLDTACFAPAFRFGKTSMKQFAEAENAWVQIAEAGDSLAGFCIVHREQILGATVGYLVTIDVADAYRRQRVGEQLLAAGESWLLTSGATLMLLHVYVKNAGAIRFYEQADYEFEEEKPGFYGPGKDAAVFWKRLKR